MDGEINGDCILEEALIEDIQKPKPINEQLTSPCGIVSALSNRSQVKSSTTGQHHKRKQGKRPTSIRSANTSPTSATHSKRSAPSHRSNQPNHSVKFSTPQKTLDRRHQHLSKKHRKRKPRPPVIGTPSRQHCKRKRRSKIKRKERKKI